MPKRTTPPKLSLAPMRRLRAGVKGLAPTTSLHPGDTGGGDTFAVGRVQQHHAGAVGGRHPLQCVAAAQRHGVGDAGARGPCSSPISMR